MEIIKIDKEFIKLGQLLKLAGIADSGVIAKIMIANGEVFVNNEICEMRGKKIKDQDIVRFQDYEIKVVSENEN